ncbi:MAG: CPBP family intramembrane glutamic endopeptidase [Anaerolineae bacterium]
MLSIVSTIIKRHSLLTFFILAYALSWCLVPWVGPSLLPWGPALAAIIMIALIEGKPGLKSWLSQMGRWRVGFQWYLIALSLPILTSLSAAWLNILFGAVSRPVEPWYNFLLLIPLFIMIGGEWEEPGWTGYALPRLQRGRSALTASLIMAVFRVGWHLPLFWYGSVPGSDILFMSAAQIVITWLYNSTRHSVLIIMVLHLMMNVCGEFFGPLFSSGDAANFAWLKAGFFVVVAIGLIIWAGPTHLSGRSRIYNAIGEPVVRG